ncbi:MAG: thiamine ABC transporter substrate-binding protein [Propionibacteriaceae bacterium]|jgi:thiamine transport system substrate-binding protein|nr:thiamine ABC transporter substrate-binding protein [Propionibacteriaceae bacterium]
MRTAPRPLAFLQGLLLSTGLAVTLAACSGASDPAAGGSSDAPASAATAGTLTVITHDSFALSDAAKAKFEAETGLSVTYVAPGNAGTVVNELVLTKDSPLGDVVFGIDNTFAGRAVDAGVLAPYTPADLPAGAADFAADGSGELTPIDFGDVCLNADTVWFADHSLAVPVTLDDLLKPEYKDLLVVTNPATSSPGLAFLLATIGAKGDPGYLDYWAALKANGVKVAASWSDAYGVDFSGSSGKGAYPLVVSYASSPMYEMGDDGSAPTTALAETCFRQVEYAGVIAGAANPEGAQQFIDFLLTDAVQSEIPDTMYMLPVSSSASLPAAWARVLNVSPHPWTVSAADIAAHRDEWISEWTTTVL